MQNDQLSQVDAGTIETRRNDILISLWKEGCCTRDELKSVLDFNLDNFLTIIDRFNFER